jgi:alpha-1,2-mannosyltransferase
VSLYAAVGKLGSLVVHSKTAEFYTIRLSLAFVCAACQTRLYSAICRTLSPRIGLLFVMVVTLSPGMFHASTAFLPSTFTMYMSMLGLASFLDWKNSRRTAQGIMWFGLGAIVGWPFAGALILPLLAEDVILSFVSGAIGSLLYNVLDGIVRCLSILVSDFSSSFDAVTKHICRLLKLRLTMLSSKSSSLCHGILLHTTY